MKVHLLICCGLVTTGLAAFAGQAATAASDNEVLPPAIERFADPATTEVPDFQRHMLPLMGRLGCNTRSCHGSFQGQGGLRLSLFGYDFKADHDALMARDEERVDIEAPEISLIIQKPIEMVPHKGGKRMEEDDWAYRMIYRWVEAGAQPADGKSVFDRLEVTPSEIQFQKDGQTTPLKVVAHWADGTKEDVTCLCRFQTNDESIVSVDDNGVVTSLGMGDTHVVAFYDNGILAVPVIRTVSELVGDRYPKVETRTEIDRLVVEKLKKLGIEPSPTCGDAEFLRRLSLDMAGSLPSPEEVKAFLASDDPAKRSKKVDELLERPTYSGWWANKLCDILGNSPRNFQGMPAASDMAKQWYEWLEKRVATNEPYDELMAGIVLGVARAPDQSYQDYIEQESAYFRKNDPANYAERETTPYFWARRNLRLPEEKALGFSYAFLGVRLECAQCHKHPFDQWTQEDFNNFKAFFEPIRYAASPDGAKLEKEIRAELEEKQEAKNGNKQPVNGGEVRNEIQRRLARGEVVPFSEVRFIGLENPKPKGKDDAKGRSKGSSRVPTASVLGGDSVELVGVDDPRAPIMKWMRDPENPYFARTFVNRVWANYFGIGIINPPDDSNLANPPSNAPLLHYLTEGFIKSGYDMKWLHREIANSETYQRGWQVTSTNKHDERNFSRALVRRLPAEALIDAVKQATASGPLLARMTTDLSVRTFGPEGTASYGRNGADYASRVFGRSARDTNCDCSRSDEPNLLQSIYLQNDPDITGALDRNDGWIAELQKQQRSESAEGPDQTSKLKSRVEAIENRLRKLAKSDADTQERLKKALQKAREQLAEADGEGSATFTQQTAEKLVNEAFLRTVSRPPSTSEMASSLDYFKTVESPMVGLRDLLWALTNTKEFITNH